MKMRFRTFGVLLFAALVCFGDATAQDHPTGKMEKRILTLEQALAIALEKNKDIQKAKEYRRQVEGRYVEERAAALPQFVLQGGFSRSRDESMKVFGRAIPWNRKSFPPASGSPKSSIPSVR